MPLQNHSLPAHSEQLPALTGLRAVAAYLVYVHHFTPTSAPRVLGEGHVGVVLFFVLSGFLITYRYATPLENARQTGRLKVFYIDYLSSRIARIWPVYILLVTVTLWITDARLMAWVMNLTLLKGFSNAWKFDGIPQSWTLTIEEVFYVLAPLFLTLIVAQKSLGALFLRVAGMTFTLYVLGGLIEAVCAHAHAPVFETKTFVILYTFMGRCFEFFCGMAAARLFEPERPHRSRTYLAVALFIACVYVISLWQTPGRFGVFTPVGMIINNLILPPIAAWLIVSLATEQTLIQRILNTRLLILLGSASYVFYLIHMGPIRDALVCQLPFQNKILIFLFLNAVAALIWKGVERPLYYRVRAFLRASCSRKLGIS